MKHFSKQLHTTATKSVSLEAAEARELRERIVSYMEYHPLPAELQKKPVEASVTASPTIDAYKTVHVPFHALFRFGSVAVALVLVAVPFLAERAMPGDTLYAVKVQFNEELRSKLTFDSFEKVEWETERLNRRIAEARLLASEGRLTEEVEAEVAAAVKEHTENAKREIEVLRGEDADDAEIASIALDTTLEVQSTSLKGEETTDGVTAATRPISLIASVIDESREQPLVHTPTSTPAYDKLMARVELNTTRLYELRDSVAPVVSTEELAEVDRRISDLERSLAGAMAEKDELTARELLVEVLQRTQKLIVFMTELEVSNTDLETIVPVILTPEEEQAAIDLATTTLAAKLDLIETLAPTIEDEGVIEKMLANQLAIEELIAQMASSTGDYEAFMYAATEALALADDLLNMLQQTTFPAGDSEVPADVATSSATSTEEISVDPLGATSTATSTDQTDSGEVGTVDPEPTEIEGERGTTTDDVDSTQ